MILAHGLGGRTDLPLPTWMVLYGGAAILVVSFAALRFLWPKPRWEGESPGRDVIDVRAPVVRTVAAGARVLGLGAFLLVLAAAAVGENDPTTNLAPTAVYITFWVGMAFVSFFVGDVWRALSPFDTLARVTGASRRPRERRPADRGYWPAAVGLLGFVWLELVYPDRAEPRVLAVAIGAYTLAVLAAAWVWGREWLRTGEAFTALFGLLSRAAPLARTDEGKLRLRPPFAGLADLEPVPGLEAVVLVVLGSTSFDGLTRTEWWIDLSGRTSGAANTLVGTLGLLWAIALVFLLYFGAMKVTARLLDADDEPGDLALDFAHSLVPIAFAYSVAHYFSLLILEGQGTISLLSDPFGAGWDLFGTSGRDVNFNLLTPTAIAWVQAGAIVVGHVVAVVVAHDRALTRFPPERAVTAQLPLLGAMVVFTVGGLFLLLGG
ncbi:MAG TPA: hypothetical protein VHH09_04070 [Acidimicrobiales bacterium]|nr:hypothetical protein [Acidimicrobiales bacterium]